MGDTLENSDLIEAELHAAWVRHELADVTVRALELYGPGVMSFLLARTRSSEDAREVYAMFMEDLWTGLPGFRWQCTLRGWLYTLARNAASRFAISPALRARNREPLSASPQAERPVEVRSSTKPHLRTEVKRRMQELRLRLEPDEQDLLILRADRQLPWRDLAIVMGGEAQDEGELKEHAARLRKRFERIKNKLRSLAREEGLLREPS